MFFLFSPLVYSRLREMRPSWEFSEFDQLDYGKGESFPQPEHLCE